VTKVKEMNIISHKIGHKMSYELQCGNTVYYVCGSSMSVRVPGCQKLQMTA